MYRYQWAVCHAGSWIYGLRGYQWVAGTRKHHHCPVRWVKYKGKLGFVPLHPRDQRGKPPVNLRHGLFTLTGRPDRPIERTALAAGSHPKLLDATPKDFRSPAPPMLTRVDAPRLAVHMMHEPPATFATDHKTIRSAPASTLTFNNRSQRFVLATRVTDNAGRSHTFSAPITTRGGAIASSGGRSNGFGGGGARSGFSGGASRSGGYSGGGGSPSGGGSSSGGSHSGGSSGGGGSHSGGGSSGGSSSSSAGASSGGAHR